VLCLLQTKGLVNAAGLMMLDFGGKGEPAEAWAEENIHSKLQGLCLSASSSSKAGYSVLASCSKQTDLRVYSSSGRWEVVNACICTVCTAPLPPAPGSKAVVAATQAATPSCCRRPLTGS
jgi:hypothetical protein